MYERRCRLGIHVRVGTKDSPREGILRVGREVLQQQQPAAYNTSVRAMIAAASVEFGDSDDMRYSLQRLRAFVEGCQAEWCRFFSANDQLFERRAFHESVYRQQQRPPRGTSLATVGCADAAAMPPPAVPSGGPASMGGIPQQQGASGVGHSPTMMMMAPHSMAQQQQTSPAAVSSGPNSGGLNWEILFINLGIICILSIFPGTQFRNPFPIWHRTVRDAERSGNGGRKWWIKRK